MAGKKNIPKTKEFYVIAHNIRSLLNVGSLFRTSDALGVTKLYLTGYTGTPHNPNHAHKIAKVALGAEKFVLWEHAASATKLIKKLKDRGFVIVGLENNVDSIALKKYKQQFPIALLLGEERFGISKPLLKLCDTVLHIPMVGKKESLNVSVAFGIAAYHLNSSSINKKMV